MTPPPPGKPPGSAMASLHAAVAGCAGLYARSPTCHLSALARVPAYTPEVLERALEVERSLARVRAMRRSVYILGGELLEVALAATRRELLRPYQAPSRQIDGDYEALARRVEAAVAGGPRSAAEIRPEVDPDRALGRGYSILIGRMASECRIVRATTRGGWRSDHFAYARWKDWLPQVDPYRFGEEEARRRLAEAYVAAYGPVTVDDVAWWTGWSKRDTRAAVAGLDLEREGEAMRRLEGVRLLPVWDALMVAYRHRERLLDADDARFVYDASGNATSVVLDGGRVVGVWDLGSSDDPLAIRVAPLGDWPQRRWDAVGELVERIGRMLGSSVVEEVRCQAPVDLREARRNRFLSPLSG